MEIKEQVVHASTWTRHQTETNKQIELGTGTGPKPRRGRNMEHTTWLAFIFLLLRTGMCFSLYTNSIANSWLYTSTHKGFSCDRLTVVHDGVGTCVLILTMLKEI